nr:unnamed protein product [Callosobruchus analis]
MDKGSVGEAKTPGRKAAVQIGVGSRLTDVSTSDDSDDAIITSAASCSLASSLRLIDSSSYQISGPPCFSGTEKGRQSAEVLGQSTAGLRKVCRHRTNALVNAQVSFSCGNCSATFPTQIGLSQHERHVHPSVRNQKRLATAAAPRKRTVGERSSRPKIWTEEEEQRLRELNEVYGGNYYINTLLMPHFPGKTSKQIISDKRCLLGLTKPVDGQATSGRATADAGNCTKSDMEEERNWRLCMLASAARTFTKHRQSLAKDAAIDSLAVEVCSIADALRTAEDIASASDLHKPKLDSIVDELTAMLAGDKPLPSSKSRRGNISNARRKPRGNRDRMRRQQYATVQSLWAKDPKLLATMVAEDTLADIDKRRQPELPKGDQVRDLYDQLWGVAGTTFQFDWDQTVEARAGVVDVNPIQLGIVESSKPMMSGRRAKPKNSAGPSRRRGGASNLRDGEGCSTTDNPPPPPAAFKCNTCDRDYATKSGMDKHAKTCGQRDRSTCQHCGIEEDTEAIPVEEEGEEKEHPLPADTSLIAEGVDTPSSPSIALVCCGRQTGSVVYSDTTLLDGLDEVEADLNTASKTDALNPSVTFQEVGDVVLQEFLEREFRYAQEAGLEAIGDIARAGLTMSPVHLREFLDLWVQNQFSTSARRPRTTRGQREPAAMNYGMRRKKPSYSS